MNQDPEIKKLKREIELLRSQRNRYICLWLDSVNSNDCMDPDSESEITEKIDLLVKPEDQKIVDLIKNHNKTPKTN